MSTTTTTPKQPKFHVIGAGLCRGGTRSLKTALEILYPQGKCYHGFEILDHGKSHNDFWDQVHHDQLTAEQTRQWFESRGYVCGVDCPLAFHYKKWLEVFPEAKIVLNVRDGRKWYRSMKNTLVPLVEDRFRFPTCLLSPIDPKMIALGYCNVDMEPQEGKGVFGSVIAGEDAAVEFYNEWMEAVKKNVPEDRLLVFNVEEGWEPLCTFLDLPVPDQPFPNVNDSAEMRKIVFNMRAVAWGVVVGLPLLTAAGLYAFFRKQSLK